MLLVNKDVTAGVPVVTPVPPLATEVNKNGTSAIKAKEEPMEVTEARSKKAIDSEQPLAVVPANVKTEVIDSSRGKTSTRFPFSHVMMNVYFRFLQKAVFVL